MTDDKSKYKVFVGGLSLNTTVESLTAHFEQYGELVDAVVMKDPTSGRSRGFGFVSYAEGQALEDCLSEKHTLDGKDVDAKKAIPRDAAPVPVSDGPQCKKVFLGGLSLDTEEDDIKAVLEQLGTVLEITIMREKETDRPRGFGFALFESYAVVEELCAKKYIKIKERDVEVKKAISQEEMRRVDSVPRGRSGGQGGYPGGRGDPGNSYSGGRDPYMRAAPYGGAVYGAGGGYDYRDYTRPESYYGYPSTGYDKSAYAAYAAANSYRGYDMSAAAYGMYGTAGMASNPYTQTASSYGPSRGTGYGAMGGGDYGKDRGGSRQYHPYRRTQ